MTNWKTNNSTSKKLHKPIIGLQLALIVGLTLLILWRITQSPPNSNLLVNSGFDIEGLTGWQMLQSGEAQASLKSVSDNNVLVLSLSDNPVDAWIGVGQRVDITPIQRYQLTLDHGLVDTKQKSTVMVIRISQFDKNGTSLKTDEFSNPIFQPSSPPTNAVQATYHSSSYNFFTYWQAATVEIGIGILGQQATEIEVDNLTLKLHPTWYSRIVSDPFIISMLFVVLALVGSITWRPISYGIAVLTYRSISIPRELLWNLVLFSGLTLIITYPVGWHLHTAIAGAHNWDALPHVWYQWWGKEAILDLGVWLDEITPLFFPLDTKHPMLALHPYVPFVSLPFTLLLGPVFSYNVALLLSFILSGGTGYLLCRYLSRSIGAAFIGGLIFAFNPNRMGHAIAGHLLWITNYFLPLYVLSLLILLKRPSRKRILWHGTITGLLALANPMDVIHGVIPILLIVSGSKILSHLSTNSDSLGQLRRLLGPIILANLFALIIYVPFAWSAISQSKQFLSTHGKTLISADLLSFVLPSPYHPFLAKTDSTMLATLLGVSRPRNLGDTLTYLGVVAVGLIVVASWRRWYISRGWLVLTAGCAILAMGPYLTIGTQMQPFALPYLWLSQMPLFEWSRTPVRFDGTVMLGTAILAAIGAAYLMKSSRPLIVSPSTAFDWKFLRYLLVIPLSILILFEYLVIFPFPMETPVVSDYYQSLAAKKLEGGVLELPARNISGYAMYYQTIHEHPLAGGGEVSRYPTGAAEFRRFLHQFLWPWPVQTVFPRLGESQIRAILVDMNIKRVITQKNFMDGDSGQATLAYLPTLFGGPIYEDAQILVHSVPVEPDNILPRWQLIPDQKNWELIQEGHVLRLAGKGNLYIYGAENGTAQLDLQLTNSSANVVLELILNGAVVSPHNFKKMTTHQTFLLPLRQGFNYIRLLSEPNQPVEFENISITSR